MDWGIQKGPEPSDPGPCVNPEGFALRGFDGLHLIARVRYGLRQDRVRHCLGHPLPT